MSLRSDYWRKSSYSGPNGGNCIELAGLSWRKSARSGENGGDCVELARLAWRKSSYTGSNGGNCVELADAVGVVAVRDSKDPDGPVILVTRAVLRSAVDSVVRGRP
ncbi:DUF397 domain-containing protein [Actinomadura sp. NTSP31]|uniref:DUF397 domain-containing protein n=1 Tax=Actinomadura sp. NTSP31 TaxID=1735447 RepID=UPI0035C25E08